MSRMSMEIALRIARDYPDTAGYELGFREDQEGHLILSDGVVQVDVTNFSEVMLRREIEGWIETAKDSEL